MKSILRVRQDEGDVYGRGLTQDTSPECCVNVVCYEGALNILLGEN